MIDPTEQTERDADAAVTKKASAAPWSLDEGQLVDGNGDYLIDDEGYFNSEQDGHFSARARTRWPEAIRQRDEAEGVLKATRELLVKRNEETVAWQDRAEAAEAKLARLEGALPHTADGVTIVPGMKISLLEDGWDCPVEGVVADVFSESACTIRSEEIAVVSRHGNSCYSTESAALAARDKAVTG